MQRVFVLDKNGKPLMPCLPVRARELLTKGKAKVYRLYPFTIILTEREGGELQEIELKVDPGSKTTGVALIAHFARGYVVVWAANLMHRGEQIGKSLEKRKRIRRSRRNRKTGYRAPRFLNRRRPKGWLAPSLGSRVQNVVRLARKLCGFVPVSQMAIETVRFDLQKMQHPEISGVEYQQGELLGYEVREYLLEKWGRKCAYCDRTNMPLEIEHIVPKSKGGTNRVSNLTLSCERCNQKKGTKKIQEFLRKDKKRLKKIVSYMKTPLKDASAVNATRYAIGNCLKTLGLPVTFWSGGRTKYNRIQQGYPKDHWIDAACVGETGKKISLHPDLTPLRIKAVGRGTRRVERVDTYGFPRTSAKTTKRVHGFQTGDLVKAVVTQGKKVGVYLGRVAIRSSGNFNISTQSKVVQGISYIYCRLRQKTDGYSYS